MKEVQIPLLVDSIVHHNFTLIKTPLVIGSTDITFVKQRNLAARILTHMFRDHSNRLSKQMPTALLELTIKNLVYLLPFFASSILFITPE
jgi:hypothetical protein